MRLARALSRNGPNKNPKATSDSAPPVPGAKVPGALPGARRFSLVLLTLLLLLYVCPRNIVKYKAVYKKEDKTPL